MRGAGRISDEVQERRDAKLVGALFVVSLCVGVGALIYGAAIMWTWL